MKEYPSINYYGDHWGLPIYGFDKLDGSNLRFEFNKKRGFYKFGSRNVLINETHEIFGEGIRVFLNKYGDGLEKVFKHKDYRDTQSFVCYGEFFGANSQYGQHYPDDTKDVVLFDIEAHKKGFIKPKPFVNDFGHLGIPKIIYQGNLNQELVTDIKQNKYNLKEGIICKGVIGSKKEEYVYQCKIKTDEWLDNLRKLGGDKALEDELKKH